jgi:hypothetical protein
MQALLEGGAFFAVWCAGNGPWTALSQRCEEATSADRVVRPFSVRIQLKNSNMRDSIWLQVERQRVSRYN